MPFRPHEKFAPHITLGIRIDNRQPFILTGKPLKDHKFISGVTGMGKSRLIAAMCEQLLNENIPFALCDPHSDLADDLLAELIVNGYFNSPNAFQRLWYIDFSRRDAFPAFNALKQPYPIDMVVLNTLESWRRAWSSLADGNAINIENVLRAATTLLVENNQPITCLPKLLTDASYREAMLQNSHDELVTGWFADRFSTKASSLIDSTLKRVFVLTYSPTLRYSLGQTENLLNFRYLMDNGISCIYNLGGLDTETTRFLGCLITTGYEQAALSRTNIPEDRRRPCHLFLDEFSQFVSNDGTEFERILTLTRKYGLTLNLACQTLSQTKEIADALQNTLHISFQLGVKDSAMVAPHFIESPKKKSFLEELFGMGQQELANKAEWTQDIKSLKQQECVVHLGGSSFHMRTLNIPDHTLPKNALADVKKHYEHLLLTPLSTIQQKANQGVPAIPQNIQKPKQQAPSPAQPTPGTPTPGKKRGRRFTEVQDGK